MAGSKVMVEFVLISTVGLLFAQVAAGQTANAQQYDPPHATSEAMTARGRIDALVSAKLRSLQIKPSPVCSDAVFLRRVFLDTIGTIPTAAEAREFLADKDADKRSKLIDRLMERDEFADYWAMKWSDLLRIKAEFPMNLWPNAAQAYHHWVRAGIRDNKPYDQFVRELLTASGSNFRDAPANFYRAVQSKDPATLARSVALIFMGARAEQWPKQRLDGMAGFFAHVGYKSTGEWKEEIVYFDRNKAAKGLPTAIFPDGTPAKLTPGQDPRVAFADWLIRPTNPWFTRNIANRSWYWLVGQGIISEPDDIRPDNPPSNPELLAYLESELVSHKYDLKHLFRLILNSQTYERSSQPVVSSPAAQANFAYYPIRRLDAEVLADAICQVTGTTERYSSAIPEPFTFIPDNQRSITLPDGSITSSFLELFGRPARDTGLESERNNRPSAAQRLFLLNSSHIHRKIEQGPAIQKLLQSRKPPREVISDIYLTILSRYPTDEEIRVINAYGPSAGIRPREAMIDTAWALVNSAEFMYRH